MLLYLRIINTYIIIIAASATVDFPQVPDDNNLV